MGIALRNVALLLLIAGLASAGALDMQTPPRQSFPAIEAALKAAKNKDVTIREIPGVNHIFQTANTAWVTQHAGAQPHG